MESANPNDLIASGEQCLATGDLDAAEVAFRRTLQMQPNEPTALNRLADVYWEKQDYSQATLCLLMAIQVDPTNRLVVLNATRIFTNLGRPADAARVCSNYLQSFPGDKEVSEVLARIRAEHGDNFEVNYDFLEQQRDFWNVDDTSTAMFERIFMPEGIEELSLEEKQRKWEESVNPELEKILTGLPTAPDWRVLELGLRYWATDQRTSQSLCQS